MAEQTYELYTGSATGTQIDAAAAKVAAMEETLSGTAGTIPSSAAVKNYVDGKSVDTVSTLSGGVVYDISEANNGTTYANLAAALNNGNNIPASIRKGGISIKFIQSSDNKYVQFRLMANSFSTTVTDWQGVDDKPTANSKNLVTSDGVHGALLNYTTTDALTLLLAGKQDIISDLATIRNGATAGATAYQKPINGISKNDLSESVQTSLNKADTALQAHQDISGKENTINKKTTITGNESSSTYYPTTKAVVDYVHQQTAQWGIVSQTQTWTQAADGGYDYTMSNLVTGYIPQANIDLYESAGATFNETSGYFELNGLTDISYEEMGKIYNFGDIIKYNHVPASINIGINTTYNNIRTVLAQQNYGFASWVTASKINFGVNIYNTIESIHLPINMPTLKGRTIMWAYNAYEHERLGSLSDHDHILKIFTGVNIDGASGEIKFYADSLEKFEVYNLKLNLDLRMSSRLNAKSLAETINFSVATSAITITLHATAYARAIADSDVQAALQSHTNVTLASV